MDSDLDLRVKKKGFTLVELSIVLVIIGLLIGGILAAQSMIQTAQVQRVIKDVEQYKILSERTYDTFKCHPGDCPRFMVGAAYTESPGQNDARDGYPNSHYVKPQLQVLGMIPNSGDLSACGTFTIATAPKSCFYSGSLKDSIFIFKYSSLCNAPNIGTAGCDLSYGPYMPSVDYVLNDVYILYGSSKTLGDGGSATKPDNLFKNSTAFAVDQKIDDGKINTGTVKAMDSNFNAGSSCRINDKDASYYATDTPYNIVSNAVGCLLAFYYKSQGL